MNKMNKRIIAGLTGIGIMLSMTACGIANPDNELNIIAGSEIKDMSGIIRDAEKELGFTINIDYSGTLDGTEKIMNNDGAGYDATWFPSNAYMGLFDNKDKIIDKSQSIMSTPVVIGVKKNVARELKWDENTPSWKNVVDAAKNGDFTFGMSNPIQSNSGFSALIEIATALSGTGNAITADDVKTIEPSLKSFASGQKITSGSSGWLMDAFDKNPDKADAVINYQSLIGQDSNNLIPIIPSPESGVVNADYELSLIKNVSNKKKEHYDALVKWLMKDDIQKRIANETHRNTKTTDYDNQIITPFPGKRSDVQALLKAWVAEARKPANMVFQIDTSGSMHGNMYSLKTALKTLTGSNTNSDSVDSLLALQPRENIDFIEFSGDVKSKESFKASDNPDYGKIDDYFDSLKADGGTNIYGTLEQSMESAAAMKTTDSTSSVVLFTDGANNGDIDYDGFKKWYESNEDVQGIPVFIIAFGEANGDELSQLADLTDGRVFQTDNLESAFKEVRGYL